MAEKLGDFETPQRKFEQEVVEPTKKAMEEAMAEATSEEDATQRIKDALPKERSFLGPLVMYAEVGEEQLKQRNILARVQTLDDQNRPVDIDAHFVG